jgi:beta-glucosidase
LLQARLRDGWGFKGYVVSDCGAVDDIHRHHKFTPAMGSAAAAAVKAGTDLTCGTEYKTLVDEVKAGSIAEADIDRALARLFVARFRLGMFDPPERVPYSRIPISENDSAAHRRLARDAANQAIVLLKNQGGLLPLGPSARRIAVIGPSANDAVAVMGNYNGISSKQVTPLEGIERGFPEATVRYALGATYTGATPALVPSNVLAPPDGNGHGVLAEYFDNPDLQGAAKLRRNEGQAYFDMEMEPADVMSAVGRKNYSVRWTATLTPAATGEYRMIVRTARWNFTGKARMFLDDQELDFTGGPTTQMTSTTPPPAFRRPVLATVRLEAGRKYAVRVEFRQPGTSGMIQLSWIPPTDVALAEAEALVKDSDVAVVCVGLSADLEGEEMRGLNIPGFAGGDRTALELPEPQESLIRTAVATGKPVIVVLTSGSAIAANHAAAHAGAVLAAWYGGEEAGSAIADTLAGKSNPAGRLPVTFYTSADQLPPFTEYAMKGRTYRYFSGTPLYPFGFGLSYSRFAYADLGAKRTAAGAEIRATVKNTSSRDGDEVVQVYVAGAPGDGSPIRSLRGFQRIHLKAGESRQVSFHVAPDDLPKGSVEVSVGGGQPLAGIPHVKGAL